MNNYQSLDKLLTQKTHNIILFRSFYQNLINPLTENQYAFEVPSLQWKRSKKYQKNQIMKTTVLFHFIMNHISFLIKK